MSDGRCRDDGVSASDDEDRNRSTDVLFHGEFVVKQHINTSHSSIRLSSASGAKSTIHPRKDTAPSVPNRVKSVPCNTMLEPVPVSVAIPPSEAAYAILRSTAVAALRISSSE